MSEQPKPTPNDRAHIADLAIEFLRSRKEKGIETYGVALQAGNGRDPLRDLKEELADALQYLIQLEQELSEFNLRDYYKYKAFYLQHFKPLDGGDK